MGSGFRRSSLPCSGRWRSAEWRRFSQCAVATAVENFAAVDGLLSPGNDVTAYYATRDTGEGGAIGPAAGGETNEILATLGGSIDAIKNAVADLGKADQVHTDREKEFMSLMDAQHEKISKLEARIASLEAIAGQREVLLDSGPAVKSDKTKGSAVAQPDRRQ